VKEKEKEKRERERGNEWVILSGITVAMRKEHVEAGRES